MPRMNRHKCGGLKRDPAISGFIHTLYKAMERAGLNGDDKIFVDTDIRIYNKSGSIECVMDEHGDGAIWTCDKLNGRCLKTDEHTTMPV